MTDDAFLRIETKLTIRLPNCYRELLVAQEHQLNEVEWFHKSDTALYLNVDDVIATNLNERHSDWERADAFHKWWETFFIVGTNGGGDFYCLRLDNSVGVWLIGSDCGIEPTLVNESFSAFVNNRVANYEIAKSIALDIAQRLIPYQEENDAQLVSIAKSGDPQSAETWQLCDSGYVMFQLIENLLNKPSPRKLRLFGMACCRNIPSLYDDEELATAMGLAEQMTLGTANLQDIETTRRKLSQKRQAWYRKCDTIEPETYRSQLWKTIAVFHLFQDDECYTANTPIRHNDPSLNKVIDAVSHQLYEMPHGTDKEMHLLREVLGNPFHPVIFLQEWRTPEVIDLARMIYDNDRFDEISRLGELLEEAGCRDLRVLSHCHRLSGHVRGCWVLDQILGKE